MSSLQIGYGLGRGKNAVQDFLSHKLLFPKIYFDTVFNGVDVDVLAIDRNGTGDVHAVYKVYQGTDPEGALAAVASNIGTSSANIVPHFIYAAVVNDGPGTRKFVLPEQIIQRSFAEDGVGRMGILYVDLTEDEPHVAVIQKPERFRSSKQIIELADQFVASHTPNWEIRE
jgi:hypothetical protein